jgi:hypothetical protein
MVAPHCAGGVSSSGLAVLHESIEPSRVVRTRALWLDAPPPPPKICAAVRACAPEPVVMVRAHARAAHDVRRPVALADQVRARGAGPHRAALADEQDRDVDRCAALEIRADVGAEQDARLGEVGVDLVGVLELDDVVLLRDPLEAVATVDAAVAQQLHGVARVRDDRDAVLHRELEVGSVVGAPVDDEGGTLFLGDEADMPPGCPDPLNVDPSVGRFLRNCPDPRPIGGQEKRTALPITGTNTSPCYDRRPPSSHDPLSFGPRAVRRALRSLLASVVARV